MRKYFLWLLLSALLLGGLSFFIVKDGNPDLTEVGLERHWKGQPFTGLLIGAHRNFQPAVFATYWRGKHHGAEILWYPNGVREWERYYKHGVYHGSSQSWYENGRVKSWRSYVDGHAEGEQWSWNMDGQVVEYNLFRNDKEIAHKTWTFDGKPFHNYVYQDGEKVGIMGEPFCKRKKQF
jgi:antitoxin component YwqK of YwqJK toxin-antitoxin module